ncbi:major tail protein [Bacillus sp. Hm123]|uniref:major tail protein n=1 Tax=Bacillus sp. Hm123 TaxID=3450745 RepID=UPI003F4382B7
MAVSIGLKNVHVAKLLKDEKGMPTTYEAPEYLAPALSVQVSPNSSSAVLHADDGPSETGTTISGIELSINIKDLTSEQQSLLLGNKIDANGAVISKTTDESPYVAIGYEVTRNDGKSHYVWLYKGMFRENEATHNTKGESIEFQTPTLTANFIKRDFDDAWKYTLRSNEAKANPFVVENFFKLVWSKSDIKTTELPAPPVAPTNLTGTPSTDNVSLAWDAVTGASSYAVYRDGEKVGSPSANLFDDTGLTASTSYEYQVAAVNSHGEGNKSPATTITTTA